MTNNLIPSFNPTNLGSLIGMLCVVLDENTKNNLDDMLPAEIIAYNRASNTAQVQPLISMVDTSGNIIQRAQIMSVPVLRLGAGNALIAFYPKSGDLGWIKANDRDISLFKQSWSQSIPNTARKHSFSDAVFIPDEMGAITLNSFFPTDAAIQTPDGTSAIGMMTSNCVLDCESTTKAFKFPTMTTVQKNAISSPQKGMAVFDTTTNNLSVYNGSSWS